MTRISVIVPVYNVEKYLSRCINSILTQTFSDFELLLINDGSTDNSGEICDIYAQKDKRIKVFHKRNEGVSAARNFGIENAIGEWIIFMDSDDYFSRNAFNLLLKTALYHKTSISTANFWIEQGENRWIFCRHGIEKAFKHSYIRLYFGLINFRAGSTLYSHQILKDHNFDTALSRYEDAKHIYGIIRNKKIAYTPTCVMTYSLDKKDGLSHKVKDISKDFIFNMDFSNKTFWECMLLGNLLNQGYSLYPEHKNILKEKYSKYVFYRYLDLAIEFFKIKQIIKRIGLY